MDLLDKISETLITSGLRVISEGRLRPVLIKTKRGKLIEADHARIVQHSETGTQILVIGIHPGIYPKWAGMGQRVGKQKKSITGRMRDFTSPGEYFPSKSCGQDESGWAEPDESGFYDAHREFTWNQKFKVILTAYMHNIVDLKWGHEAEKKVVSDNRIDWRGQLRIGWAMFPIIEMLETFPDVILKNQWPKLIEGVNVTIAARSQQLGFEPSIVELISLKIDSHPPLQDNPAHGQVGIIGPNLVATWISQNYKGISKKGISKFPLDTKFAELAYLLEKAVLEEQRTDGGRIY